MRGSVRDHQYVLVVPGVLGDGVAGWLPVGWAYVEGPVCGHDEPVADTEAVAAPREGGPPRINRGAWNQEGVTHVPEPLSPRNRNRVHKVEPTYRSHNVQYLRKPHKSCGHLIGHLEGQTAYPMRSRRNQKPQLTWGFSGVGGLSPQDDHPDWRLREWVTEQRR